MNSAVYALAENALFRVTPYHYAFAALGILQIVRLIVNRICFISSVSWIPGPPALPLVGNALSLTGEQHGEYRGIPNMQALFQGRHFSSSFRLPMIKN